MFLKSRRCGLLGCQCSMRSTSPTKSMRSSNLYLDKIELKNGQWQYWEISNSRALQGGSKLKIMLLQKLFNFIVPHKQTTPVIFLTFLMTFDWIKLSLGHRSGWWFFGGLGYVLICMQACIMYICVVFNADWKPNVKPKWDTVESKLFWSRIGIFKHLPYLWIVKTLTVYVENPLQLH